MKTLFEKNDAGEFVPVEVETSITDKNINVQTPGTKTNVEKLTDVVNDLAENINKNGAMAQYKEEMDEKLRKMEELVKAGVYLPDNIDTSDESISKYFTDRNIDISRQGKRLTSKFNHPGYRMSEEKREEVAEWMALALKTFGGDFRAREIMEARYKTGTDAIGDSSNNSLPIPDPVNAEILKYAREDSTALQDCTIVDMSSEKTSYPIETSGAAFLWSNTTSQSTPVLDEVELSVEEVSAYAEVRNMTLADSPSDIVGWLFELMSSDLGQELDTQLFTGTGSPCSGLLTAICGYSVNMGTGSAAFSMVSSDTWSEMIRRLDGKRKAGAKYYMNGEIIHWVRQLKDTNERPIFLETIGSAVPGTIWGKQYKEVTVMPSESASSTAFAILGNLKNFYLGRRVNSASFQINTQGDTPWTTNRSRFKLYARWALNAALPNAFVRAITSAS